MNYLAYPSTGSRGSKVAPLLVLIGLLGCADPDWQTAYRLERAAALADLSPETVFLDFGTEQARRFLIDGWSFNETNDAGLTFVWSHGPSSSFGFYVVPEDGELQSSATLRFRVLPFEAPDAPEQRLRFELNGRPLGESTLPAGVAESTLQVPADLLITGWNVFEVFYAWTRSDLASQADRRWRRNDRDLAVAWIEARLDHEAVSQEPVEPAPIEIDLRAERLSLPARHLLEYEFEIDRGDRLVADARCDDCGPDWRLVVSIGALDDATLRFAGALDAEQHQVALGVERPGTYRILLRNPSSGRVVLHRPRIERPAAPRTP